MPTPKHHQLAARLAAAVYIKNEGDLRNELHRIGVCASTAEIVEGPGSLHERALLVPANGVVFVVFRGTQNRRQWLSDFDAHKVGLPVRRDGVKSHKGFRDGYVSLLDGVLAALSIWRVRHLVIVGHSRGSGEAIDFALCGATFGKRIDEIHLFGCPRTLNPVGSALFGETFPGNCWNWVCNNDAVFRVPFKWMGFRHVGRIMYFDSKDRLRINPSFWTLARGEILGRLRGGLFDGINDHNAVKEYDRLVGRLELV